MSHYFNIKQNFCRSGSSTQPIWRTYMYSTSSHRCYGTGNTCPSSTVTSCTHSEDVTVQCCKHYNSHAACSQHMGQV